MQPLLFHKYLLNLKNLFLQYLQHCLLINLSNIFLLNLKTNHIQLQKNSLTPIMQQFLYSIIQLFLKNCEAYGLFLYSLKYYCPINLITVLIVTLLCHKQHQSI